MATLQAARATELGLSRESAKSWGLNRAIFYAAAKRGFRGKPPGVSHATSTPSRARRPSAPTHEYTVGNEKGFVSTPDTSDPLFVIGGETQTPKDFDKQVSSRFNGRFDVAWEDALDYVRHFDREILESGEEFFNTVYRPRRDELAAKWTELASETSRSTVGSDKRRR